MGNPGLGSSDIKYRNYLLMAIVIAGVAWRLIALFTFNAELHSDIGLHGLMAKHISEGRNFPVFYYGQNYMGALDQYLTAMFVLVFGPGTLVLRFPSLIMFGIFLVYFHKTMEKITDSRMAFAATLMAAFPCSTMTFITSCPIIIEAVLGIQICIYYTLKILRSTGTGFRGDLYKMMFLSGLFCWVNQMVLIAFIPQFIIVMIRLKSRPFPGKWKCFVFGCLLWCLGSLPLVIFNIVHPLATFRGLIFHKWVYNTGEIIEKSNLFNRVLNLALYKVLNTPTTVDSFSLAFIGPEYPRVVRIPVALFLIYIMFVFLGRNVRHIWPSRKNIKGYSPLNIHFILVVFGILAFLGEPPRRYMLVFIPAVYLSIVLLARWTRRFNRTLPVITVLIILMLGVFSFTGASFFGPGHLEYRKLVNHLQEKGFTRIHAQYRLAYTITFLSNEKIIATPTMKVRYMPYDKEVLRAGNPAVVYLSGSGHERRFREQLESNSVKYKHYKYLSFVLFYDFSDNAMMIQSIPRIEEW